MVRAWSLVVLLLTFSLGYGPVAPSFSQEAKEAKKKNDAKGKDDKKKAKRDDTPPAPGREPKSTPISNMKVKKGFKAELLYSVPAQQYGSWVNLCVDPKGRLIVSDQKGSLYRVTVPPAAAASAAQAKAPPELKIEKINVDIGEAQGLLWAFDSLYVVVNKGGKYASGVYRVRDTNGDDQLDTLDTLRVLEGGGEHGPHAVLLTPDKKSLMIVCGNGTKLTEINDSRVPRIWGEDHLLPRMPDGRGFMKNVLGPGGCIYKIDPEGKKWELFSNGFRNEFDAAFNRDGELFSYDADMEWDVNTPWYRPTRVCHVTSGSEWGWRNGAGKWPVYYADNLPPVVNVGPGSPTGIVFGYGAKFPQRYQDALYICDWSYGKLYATHLTPNGSSYTGELEEFVTGTPLPLTDVIINPQDGAMYFTIGGRGVQSGLYRVTYVGGEDPPRVVSVAVGGNEQKKLQNPVEARTVRQRLEAFHGRQDASAVKTAWPELSSPDRFIRFAARVAIEHQNVAQWRELALAEKNPQAAITGLLALVRATAKDPFHRPSDAPPNDEKLKQQIADALESITWSTLNHDQRLELLRVYHVYFNRYGTPNDAVRHKVIQRFDALYPTADRELNADLGQILVFLGAPAAAAKTMALLEKASSQEEQIEHARDLRVLKTGWTPELRKSYFSWFVKASNFKGGASFTLFVKNIKTDAIATLTDAEKETLKPIIEAEPTQATMVVAPPRPFVKDWKFDELTALVADGLKGRNFEHGKAMFGAANCFACHRFDNDGGAMGPDLSALAGRFNPRDVLESIVEPSKVISDQYAAITIVTTGGQTITGRIVNLHGVNYSVNTNMLDPQSTVKVKADEVEEIGPSRTSMMPQGLLNTLNKEEVLDLLAYLLSRGDRNSPMFK